MTDFLQRLKQRKLVQWAVAYVAAAFALLQGLDIVAQRFGWPESIERGFIVVLAIGFFVTLVLAWYHGERGAQRATGTELLILALLLTIGGGLLWRVAQRAPEASPATVAASQASAPTSAAIAEKSIAVLPFTDLSPTHDQEYFSDGMAEELLNALAKVKDLKVAGRTSSFQYKGKNADLRAIGHELGVANILEGSVRKQGDKVRITAQLIQTEDGFHLWSESYDGDLKDIFALQERIARAITDQLKVILQGGQQQQLVNAGTSNAQAYALFLEATAVYNRRDYEHMDAAIAVLEQALTLDPHFARAQARLATIYVVYDNKSKPWTELALLAEGNARKAIELDGSLAEPYAVLGRVYFESRRFAEAHAAFKHALELEPQDVTANFWWAMELIMTGYTRAGDAQLDRALALDPAQPNAQLWRALESSYAGDQQSAQRAAQRAADLGLSFAVYAQAEVAHAQGDNARAIAYISSRWKLRVLECGAPAADAGGIALAGMFGGAADARAQALAVVEQCIASQPDPTPFWTTSAILRMDQPARALAVAQIRLTDNEDFLFQLIWSPYGNAARRLPAFAEFARKTGLADVWEKYGAPDDCKRVAPRDYTCT
jgi:TolB-like protein/Tfp pilus assembly protein PilF